MNLSVEGRLRRAAHLAVLGGTVGAVVAPQVASAQDAGATQLQGVTVTGSAIRRVDTETANEVITLGRQQIEGSGATTAGQLLEQLPTLTGDALTAQVNNGGAGDGANTISLRGLGSARTLILVDGRRVVTNDVNTIPIAAIDHIEVLLQGAGTVYGSDAVGGVVNFITRKTFTGTEITTQFGVAPDNGDGEKFSASLTQGFGGSKSHAVLGISYDNNGAIKASDRDVGREPYGLIYGNVYGGNIFGSSRIPTGRFCVAGTSTSSFCGANSFAYSRLPGTDGRDPTDFASYGHVVGITGTYNYQAENLLYTPNDHVQLFALGKTDFNDSVHGYANLMFNHTGGHNQLAPEAFDSSTLTDPNGNALSPVISQYSLYNPLGQDVTKFSFRAVESGDRIQAASEDIYTGTLGVKVDLLDRFVWDTAATYSRENDTYTNYGNENVSQLSTQLGPSEVDPFQSLPDGSKNPHYGQATCFSSGAFINGTQINGCTPINILGTWGTTYAALASPLVSQNWQDLFQASSSISGELFKLPFTNADAIQGAIGAEFRQLRSAYTPDQALALYQVSSGGSSPVAGAYHVQELYGEFLVPIVKDLPGVKSLNLDVGTRYSHYSNFGDTQNGKYQIEYRPIKDLLLRATYSDVFRAPTINNLYAGTTSSAPSYTDPCNGYYDGSALASNPACAYIPKGVYTADSSYQQANNQGSVRVGGNPNLQPERGSAVDFGAVYSPEWYRPLSLNFDWWSYRLHDSIGTLDLQTALQACATSGNPYYCGTNQADNFYQRDVTSGQIDNGLDTTQNVGTLFTDGFDFGLSLNYPHTVLGGFRFDMNGTYLDKFQQDVAGVTYYSQAGQNGGPADFIGGGYPRLKMTSSLTWTLQDLQVVLRNRFISGESDNGGQDGKGNYYGLDLAGPVGGGQVGYIGARDANVIAYKKRYDLDVDPQSIGRCNQGGQQYTATSGGAPLFNYTCWRDSGYVDYQDIQITYKVKPIRTDFTVGVNDIFDQGAQIAYTFGPSFNYDASNYDVTGRFVYGRLKVYLK